MTPTRAQELAVLRSVVYASLFDYPLTLAQLHASLIGVRADADDDCGVVARRARCCRRRSSIATACTSRAGRGDLVDTRARREALSRELLDRDRRILSLVSAMPFVRMVALSGSLAHLNAEGVGRSRSVRDHRAASRVERDGRDAGPRAAARMAQARSA